MQSVYRIYEAVSNKVDGFYLAGGTALSLHYFRHRASFDLDFFTQQFSEIHVEHIVKQLVAMPGVSVSLMQQQLGDHLAKLKVYEVRLDEHVCKVDFVEDVQPLLKSPKKIDGIDVLSIEDIYLRKIFAIAGGQRVQDMTGKDMMVGGRQEPKDFFDLFYLSNTFVPLAQFVQDVSATHPFVEGIVHWYKTFDRIDMKTGLLNLITDKDVDFNQMDKHICVQVDAVLENLIGDIE